MYSLRELGRMNSLALMAVFAGLFLAPCDRLHLTAEIKYSDVCFVAAAAAVVLEAFRHRRAIRLPISFLITLPLFVITSLVTQYLGNNRLDQSEFLHFLVAAFGLPLILGWALASSILAIRIAIVGWVAGATLSAFVVLCNKHGYFPLHSFDESIYWSGRYSGLSLFANELGAFSALVLPFLMMWLFDRRTPLLLRLVAVPALLLNFYAIQLSGSRSGILAAIAAMLVFGFDWLRRRPVQGVAVILFAGLAFYAGSMISNCNYVGSTLDCSYSAWDRLFGGNGSKTSNMARETLLSQVSEQLDKSPVLGVGYHAIRISHNNFLQVLVSGGIIALLSFLLYLGTVIYWYFKVRPVPGDGRGLEFLVPALYGSFACWIVHGMLQPDTIQRNFYVPIGLLLALRIYCANMPSPVFRNLLLQRLPAGRQASATP
jgi:O-antigen ligase